MVSGIVVTMNQLLIIVQIIISVLLIALISIQGKGGGLGSAFGGSGVYHERRGVEKFVFQLTIGLSVLFLITSIANLLV